MEKNNMKNLILLVSVASFFLFIQAFSVSAITVTCTPCSQGSCNCNVATCSSGSGMLTIYKTSDCSGAATFAVPFTANTAVWYPDSFGAYFGKVLCDDRVTQSACNRIDVLQTTTVTTTQSSETYTESTTETSTETSTEISTAPSGGGGSDLGLWVGIIILILIIAVAVYFLFFKKKKSKGKQSYEDLYRKWSR